VPDEYTFQAFDQFLGSSDQTYGDILKMGNGPSLLE
jgi:hypothetical protein